MDAVINSDKYKDLWVNARLILRIELDDLIKGINAKTPTDEEAAEAAASDPPAASIAGATAGTTATAAAAGAAASTTVATTTTNANAAATTAAATSAVDNSQEDKYLVLINITNPNGAEAEIVYKNTYSICGVRDDDADAGEPIILYLTRYNAEIGLYMELADTDGKARWTVGSNGVFTRSILLEEGENLFAIAACKASVIEAAQTDKRIINDEDIQIYKFTILYRAQNVAEKISEALKELTIANILKEMDNH